MTIKTFRGMMAADTQDIITLHTNDGSTGYRIVKFQILSKEPFQSGTVEHVIKVYKTTQSTIDDTVDFSDNRLLGVATWHETSDLDESGYGSIIFDNEIFNQDIYVTHSETSGAKPCNYYLELEQVKLDLNENTVATLKDIRNLA